MLFKQLGQGEFLPLIFLLLLGVDALRKQTFIVCGDLSGCVQVYIGKRPMDIARLRPCQR